MMAAASLSTRPRSFFVSTPRPHRRPLASYEVTRSSCRRTGTSRDNANFRRHSRARTDISLSDPSLANGKPITSAAASYSASRPLMRTSNFFQLSSVIKSRGRVVNRSSSQTATPTRFVPGSRQSILPLDGTNERSVISPGLIVSLSCTDNLDKG